jgi:hypothetical protein
MSWVKIEYKHEEKFKRNFVLCTDAEEREFVIDSIIEIFSFLRRDYLEEAFDDCCRLYGSVCERKKFFQSVKAQVGKRITVNHVMGYTDF